MEKSSKQKVGAGESFMPEHNSQYQDAEYWDNRYLGEAHYEWLAGYSDLAGLLEEALERFGPSARILQLGCGNSDLSLHLAASGYCDITNIDISAVCVANMREKYPDLTFLEMDMTQLDFPEDSFDMVIEKATLDSLLVSAPSPWNLQSPGHRLVTKALREVKRVLRPEGILLSITFSQPHHRVPLLAQTGLDWTVQIWQVFTHPLHSGTRVSKVDKLSCKGSVLDYYVMRMEEGGEASGQEALNTFGIGKGPHLENMPEFVSEDEEDFINSLRVCSGDEDSSEEEQNNSS